MSMTRSPSLVIDYPDDNGEPLSDNTLQLEWIIRLLNGLMARFDDDPDVFIAGDLLWYPVEGDNVTRVAPDAMVVFGRPKGYRGSYMQWKEAGIPPQVVFEVLSPSNRAGELSRKLAFYDRHGVEEYYMIDFDYQVDESVAPRNAYVKGWYRVGGALAEISDIPRWVSPRLGIRFETSNGLHVYGPDGREFDNYVDASRRAHEERQRADEERRRAEAERQRADEGEKRAEAERLNAARLAEKLRALGIDPDA